MEPTEYDGFIGKIFKIGNSLAITIPEKNCQFSGLKECDLIKVWFKKKEDDKNATLP